MGFLPNEDSSLFEPKVVEIENMLKGLVRALQDHVQSSAFSLNT